MPGALEGFFENAPPRDMLIGWSIVLGPLLVLAALGFFFLHPTPIAPELVQGCYVANGSPALSVQHGSIRIGEPERRTLTYVAEPNKVGYRLTVTPALSLRPAGVGRYAFVQDERGLGYFWPLLPKSSDDPRNMREPSDYGGRFQIIAWDGATITYNRSESSVACQ